MPEKGGLIVVGFGAGAIDRHMHAGNVWPGYAPGAKADFTPQDHENFANMRRWQYRVHPGGNWMNTGSYLRTRKGNLYQEVRSCTLVGEDDMASIALRKHMERIGFVDESIIVPNYEPSVSVIQRGKDENGHVMDRMVRGRPRGGANAPKDNQFTPERVATASRDADVVVIASLKSQVANRTVMQNTPVYAKLSVNLGSSEVSTPEKAAEARRTLAERKSFLLAINDEEIQQLYDEPDTDPYDLAARATKDEMAENVMVTCGSKGVLLAHNGDAEFSKTSDALVEAAGVAKIDPCKIVSTLGAGDRAHAIALDELLRNTPPEKIPGIIAEGALEVLRVAGAHEDLYSKRARLMKFGRRLCANSHLVRA